MKKIIDIIEASEEDRKIGQMWAKRKKDLDNILKSSGWDILEYRNGKMQSIGEDTIITFELDDYLWEPFISDVKCKFYGGSENTLREFNGLVDLYKKIHDFKWSEIKR